MAEIDDQLLERLVAYVDGEASPSETAEIEKLIETDPTIRAEVEELRKSGEILRKLMKAEAETTKVPGAWLDLVRQDQQGTSPRFADTWKTWLKAHRLILIAGFCALLLLIAVVVLT